MNQREFHLTLLSNSSMNYFPDNKTTSFSTQLPKSLHLDGEWVVGLTEFQFPCSLESVSETSNIIYIERITYVLTGRNKRVQSGTEWMKTKIASGNYISTGDVIAALNSNKDLLNKVLFQLDQTSNRVSISVLDRSIVKLTMSSNLCLQLGFEPNNDFRKDSVSKHPANVLLGLPSQLLVYCDLIEPQIIGDVFAQVLRVCVLDNKRYVYGTQQAHIFSPTHYVPVLRREFENIEIHIRTSTGENVPFLFGTACVKLHFKKL